MRKARWWVLAVGAALLAVVLWQLGQGGSQGAVTGAPSQLSDTSQSSDTSRARPPPEDSDTSPPDEASDTSAAVWLSGRVTDEQGQPVGGVYLAIVEPGTTPYEPLALAESGEDGSFTLDAPAEGSWRVELRHPDYPVAERVVEAPAKGLRLVLPEGGSVEAQVVDEAGRPVQGAQVELEQTEERGTVDEAGRVVLKGLLPGRYRVVASTARDEAFRAAQQQVELRDMEQVKVRLQLAAGQSLAGVVVDGKGQPVAGAQVRVLPDALLVDRRERMDVELAPHASRLVEEWSGGAGKPAVSGADGSFRVEHLWPGRWLVRAEKEGYTFNAQASGPEQSSVGPYTGVVVATGSKAVRLVLAVQGHVRGRLLRADGSPVKRFQLNGHFREDAGGVFAWPVRSSGRLVLAFAAAGVAGTTRVVQAREGEDEDLGDVVLGAGRPVRVRVVDAATGAPLEGAFIDLRDSASEDAEEDTSLLWRVGEDGAYLDLDSNRTRADGTVELPHVEDRALVVLVSRGDYESTRAALGAGQRELTVRLRARAPAR
jgi:protocatechuate 3,4-dioxygenase beta subunit